MNAPTTFARCIARAVHVLGLMTCLVPGITMAEKPPAAPVRTVVDEYFGDKVSDAYRYMEDFKNPEVQAWVKSQAEYAERTLDVYKRQSRHAACLGARPQEGRRVPSRRPIGGT